MTTKVTPNLYAQPVTEWKQYTPVITGVDVVNNVFFESRRVGQELEVRYRFGVTTRNSSAASFSLGYDGTNGNVAAKSGLSSGVHMSGVGFSSTAGTYTETLLAEAGSGVVKLGLQFASGSGLSPAIGTAVFSNGESYSGSFSVPIQGW